MFPVAVSTPPGVPFDPAALAGLPLAPTAFEGHTTGRELEAAVRAGRFAGVLDLAPVEVAEWVVRGEQTDRLTAAAEMGLPQVVAPGWVDWVMLYPAHDRQESFRGRVTVMAKQRLWGRTTPQEMDRIGLDIAQKACAARGPTVLMLPLAGLSSGRGERDPGADAALFQSVRNWVYGVEVVELDLRADDPRFVRAAAERLAAMLAR